jgi:hypothetical protein
MIKWLKNYKGEQAAMENNSERIELLELRKEMKKLKKKYDHKIKGDDDKEGRVESDSEPDEEEDHVEELIEQKKTSMVKKGPRTSVSAEVYGMFNEKKAFEPKVVPKSEDQIQRIQTKVLKSFIFNSLDERDLKTVVDAMEEFTCKENDEVIKQGDPGSVLYIIEKGTFDCFKQFVSTIFYIICIMHRIKTKIQPKSKSISQETRLVSLLFCIMLQEQLQS